jgi:hypothetical protein
MTARTATKNYRNYGLLLPGALLMAMRSELLAPLMLVDLGFASFL